MSLQVAYLVNQYPKVSHSFIRREILALEITGWTIVRFSLRRTPKKDLSDKEDIKEQGKTTALLDSGLNGLFMASLILFANSPLQFLKAFNLATKLGKKNQRGILRHWIYLAEACLLKQKAKSHCISHFHAHFGTNSTTVAMLCKLLGGPNYSFTVHGPEEFDDPIGLSLESKIQQSSFVVAISNFGRSQLMRQCSHEQWGKIKVVHCVVDDNFLEAPDVPLPEAPRLVCVGRLCEQKGQLLLLEALKRLDEEGVSFHMSFAGDGEMRQVVEQRIRELGLQGKVAITGWISGEQVKEEILSSVVMVLPSFAEGLPVVIMEALALKRPVISTYVAGIPELVEHDKNGWLVPAGSVDDLVLVLKEVLSTNRSKLISMGAEGAKRVGEQHNAAIEARKLQSYIEECYQ